MLSCSQGRNVSQSTCTSWEAIRNTSSVQFMNLRRKSEEKNKQKVIFRSFSL